MLSAGAAAFGSALPFRRSFGHPDLDEHRLTAKPATVNLTGSGYTDTTVWAYEGTVPGPELRIRQGEPVRIVVSNKLGEDTTVHWHGIRLPNAMDGVPGLTQKPIRSGESFVYEFTPPDAGTFWYHPHADTLQRRCHGNGWGAKSWRGRTMFHAAATASCHRAAASALKIRSVDRETRCR
jgi:FtsP/CotA-like multicopper oxidase with cupredoxin domain